MPRIGPPSAPPTPPQSPCGHDPWVDIDTLQQGRGPSLRVRASPRRPRPRAKQAAVVVRPVVHVHNTLHLPRCATERGRREPALSQEPVYPAGSWQRCWQRTKKGLRTAFWAALNVATFLLARVGFGLNLNAFLARE